MYCKTINFINKLHKDNIYVTPNLWNRQKNCKFYEINNSVAEYVRIWQYGYWFREMGKAYLPISWIRRTLFCRMHEFGKTFSEQKIGQEIFKNYYITNVYVRNQQDMVIINGKLNTILMFHCQLPVFKFY